MTTNATGLTLHPKFPSECIPYLSQNDILPTALIPLLNEYLFQLSQSIEALDNELADLEAVVHAKKTTRALLKRERTIHSGIKSPVRSIPPELWSIIFGYVLGAEPFGVMERQTYTCLRSVCSSWRRVATATPGLCTGLEIDIEKWLGYRILSSHDLEELLDAFKDDIDPWLSILSSTSPYHLNLTSGPGFHDDTRFMKDLEREAIVDYLLTTLTSPIFLSTPSSDIFWLIIDSDTYYPSVHYLNLDLFFEVTPSLLRLSEKFPNLENLVVESKYSLADFDTSHPNLRSLTLLDLETLAGDFAPFLGCLPTLRELKISSHEVVSPWPDAPRLTAPITHPTLEIIAIRGEDLILLLEYLVAPSLKFFGIEGWGWDDRESHTLVSMVSHFLERSHPANITVSMRGIFTSSFFNPFTQHLPASASLIHLAGNLKIQDDEDEGDHRLTTSSVLFRSGTPKEIFCRDLRWIKEGVSLAPQNPSINILMPSHPGNEELRSDLESWGYEVKVCSQHDMGRMIRATFPRMSIKWGLREEFS